LFLAEAQILSSLSHPGIVCVIDFGAVDGVPYLAMEHIDGLSLHQLCEAIPQRLRLPVNVAVTILADLCHALAHAHAAGIAHGDVSPSNVMIRKDGGITLIDFGVSEMGDAAPAGGRLVFGKPGYMAPELLVGDRRPDPRGDVFCAGVVLHELLTGLYGGGHVRLVAETQVPPPSRRNSSVTPALDAIRDVRARARPGAAPRKRRPAWPRRSRRSTGRWQSRGAGGGGERDHTGSCRPRRSPWRRWLSRRHPWWRSRRCPRRQKERTPGGGGQPGVRRLPPGAVLSQL
jgi:serine/threonine protein kinase